MDSHALAIFKAVVDHHGFGRAAAATFLTQSAVSQAIRRLETEVGAPLLTRTRPPATTPAGARLYRHAADALARDAVARREIEEAIGKLGANNRIDAYRLARQRGWL